MDPIRKIPKKFTKKFGNKINIFVERLGLCDHASVQDKHQIHIY